MDVTIFDLAGLRYRFTDATRRSVAALSPAGEVLALVEVPAGVSQREAAYRAADAALERGRVTRADPTDPTVRRRCRVALYNPHSAEVAVGGTARGEVFSAGRRLEVPEAGLVATLVGGELVAGEVTLGAVDGADSTARALAAHRD